MKPTDNLTSKTANNPYHVNQLDLPFSPEETGVVGAFRHEVSDLVRLELTAEQMVGDEVNLARAYIREDTQTFWGDIKASFTEFELITSDWLLRAADPTRVDWQLNHWWEDEESQFRH